MVDSEKAKHTTARAVILYTEILLQFGHVDEIALFEDRVAGRRSGVRIAERAISELSLVTWSRWDNLASSAFVGRDTAGVWEAIVGKFDAPLNVTAQAEVAEGDKGQGERQKFVHCVGLTEVGLIEELEKENTIL